MKKTANIKKTPIEGNNGFCTYCDNKSDNQLATLANFLYTELNSPLSYEYFTNWLKQTLKTGDIAPGEIFALTEEHGKILIHSNVLGDPDPHEDKTYVFTTTKEYLLELIDDWLRTTLGKPGLLNVLIEQDEQGKVTFTWLGEVKMNQN